MGKVKILCVIFLMTFWLSAFSQENDRLKLHLSLNQYQCVVGDTIYYRLFLFDHEGKKQEGSYISEVLLVDWKGDVVGYEKSRITNGYGIGQTIIPKLDRNQSLHLNAFIGDGVLSGICTRTLGYGWESEIPEDMSCSQGYTLLANPKHIIAGLASEVQLTLRDFMNHPISGDFTVSIMQSAFSQNRASQIGFEYPSGINSEFSKRLTLTGQIFLPGTNFPLSKGTLLVFLQQKHGMLYQSTVGEDGRFSLELLDFYGLDELICAARLPSTESVLMVKNPDIDWLIQGMDLPMGKSLMSDEQSTSYSKYLEKKRRIDRSYDFFLKAEEEQFGNQLRDLNISPDVHFNIQKYVVFPDMGDLIEVIVNPLFYGELEGKETIRARYLANGFASAEPLYFIDGFATFDTDFVLSIDPSVVKEIDVIHSSRKLARYGLLGINGIVIIRSEKGTLRPEMNESNIIKGLTKPVTNTIELSSKENKKPIFRSVDYWDAQLIFDESGTANVQFVNAEDLGEMTVFLEGYSDGGTYIKVETTISSIIK